MFVVEGGGFGVYVFGLGGVGVDEPPGEGDGLSLGVADWETLCGWSLGRMGDRCGCGL